jgi:hypothetical protein
MQKEFTKSHGFPSDGETNMLDFKYGIKLILNHSCWLSKSYAWLMWYPEEEWDHDIKMDLLVSSPNMEIKLMEKMRNKLYALITSVNNLVKETGTDERTQELVNQAVALMKEDKIDRMEQLFYRSHLSQDGRLEAKQQFWTEWVAVRRTMKPFFEEIHYKGTDQKIISLFQETLDLIVSLQNRLKKTYV